MTRRSFVGKVFKHCRTPYGLNKRAPITALRRRRARNICSAGRSLALRSRPRWPPVGERVGRVGSVGVEFHQQREEDGGSSSDAVRRKRDAFRDRLTASRTVLQHSRGSQEIGERAAFTSDEVGGALRALCHLALVDQCVRFSDDAAICLGGLDGFSFAGTHDVVGGFAFFFESVHSVPGGTRAQ